MIVRFPDNTVVTACALTARRELNPERDFGLYMDGKWKPTWEAVVIPWRDYGLPECSQRAAISIAEAFTRARQGERLEIGCVGGHGRTGTVLACMAVIAGVSSNSAVKWVRDNYDERAVETSEQEHWVEYFADRLAAGDLTI